MSSEPAPGTVQHRRYLYRSNGTWQIVLAIVLVPVCLIVVLISAFATGFCGDWGTDEECADVARSGVIRVSVFAGAIIVLLVIGAVRRIRSSPSSTLDGRRLAKISTKLGALNLALLLAALIVGVDMLAQFCLLTVAAAATSAGVAALINLPRDKRATVAFALTGIVVAIASFVAGLIL